MILVVNLSPIRALFRIVRVARDQETTVTGNSLYLNLNFILGKPHPDPVVETASLASVEPPEVWHDLSLPEETVMEGKLSALPLAAVTHAVSYPYI